MAILGCSKHSAYIQSKCNGRRLCELLNASDIIYNRILDDISTASVTVPLSGDMSEPCCSCLKDVAPWCHQLTIVREGDGVVWTGPVQRILYGRDSVTIEAKDKLAWLQYRVNEILIDFSLNGPPTLPPYTPLTDMAEIIMEVAMAEDADTPQSPCFLEDAQGRSLIIIPPGINGNLSDGLPPDFPRQFRFDPFVGPTAWDDLNQLSEAGLDYTVVNHNVILTGDEVPPRAIGILTDEMILGDVQVIKDGTLMSNSVYIRWDSPNEESGGDDDPEQCKANCDAACACSCDPCESQEVPTSTCFTTPCPGFFELPLDETECYGRLERVVEGLGVTSVDTAEGIAEKYVNRGKTAPILIEFPAGTRISPNCPWGINDMIPGQRLDVALSTLCLPVFQSFKIQGMSVTDDGTEEIITVDLIETQTFT